MLPSRENLQPTLAILLACMFVRFGDGKSGNNERTAINSYVNICFAEEYLMFARQLSNCLDNLDCEREEILIVHCCCCLRENLLPECLRRNLKF